MISLHNVASAGQALHYFARDNYYTEHQGLHESEWFGKGAQTLGFEGKIDRAAFMRALAGEFDGQEIGKRTVNEKTGKTERQHRPGTDITFSAPKSVSLLAEVAGARDVREAHENAVKTALGHIERELAVTRQMKDGERQLVRTGNLVVGLFRHNTSRDLDPQTHTHAIVMNATRRDDGEWRSLQNDAIYRAQRVIGAIYTAELADRLQALGYELRRTDERGNFEIAGITREQIEHFSQRRAEMEAAMKARGLDIDSASAGQKEAAALATRDRKRDVDHEALRAQWKERAADVGIDFGAIAAKAASQREQGGVIRDDRLSGRQAMEFAAGHLIEREAVVTGNELLRTAIEHGAGRVSAGEVTKAFDKLVRDGDLLELQEGRYTTKKMLGSERWALDQVRGAKGQTVPIADAAQLAEAISAIERRQGFRYTDGQREAITTVLASRDRFVAVQGMAGTGKTTMLRGLRELAEANGYTVRGMAPTGAATKVLGKEAGIAAETVAMFQIKERKLQKDIEFAQPYAPDFVRRPELWVVDESSFLSQRQKAQLDHMANRAGAKLVYLGDTLQLQGVEAGKPFEMAQRAGIETAFMTEISRQKEADLRAAVDIITGRDQLAEGARLAKVELNNNARAFEFMVGAGMVREIKDRDVLAAVVEDVVALPRGARENTIVITAFNKDRRAINDGVRAGLQARGELSAAEQTQEVYESKGWTRAKSKEAQYYQPNDVVRFGRSYKTIAVEKGEYLRVLAPLPGQTPHAVRLQKRDGTIVEWQPRKHNSIEVYEGASRALAVGDRIRITRNGGDFHNGDVARVLRLDGQHATLEVGRGAEATRRELDLEQNKHWDHAYASTVHAAQGATQQRAVFHIRAPIDAGERGGQRELDDMAKVFGARSFYVGSTRASHALTIYTNDKGLAASAVVGKQDKTSAVETLQRVGLERQPATEQQQRA